MKDVMLWKVSTIGVERSDEVNDEWHIGEIPGSAIQSTYYGNGLGPAHVISCITKYILPGSIHRLDTVMDYIYSLRTCLRSYIRGEE